jgi:formate hydrogenlyase subunit 3/multisubunit Na+/H+ antiporter MnhD subunit
MVMVVISRDGELFLFSWEIMALAAFFLVATEQDREEARAASWIYFVAAHVGTLCLFALFALLHNATGTFRIGPIVSGDLKPAVAAGMFLLALVAFGIKAGVMPLHVWLPGAHAAAPSHVSAALSGIVLKTGIYGLVRIGGMLPNPPIVWGAALLALGAVSAVVGVTFAVGQHDLKRLLAYHSVENIGIIVMGLGLAMIGRSFHQPAWIALGLGGAILHVWNHSLFKSLLFLAAGSVVHATGTREIDRLGGLARAMPRTAAFFALGAIAICGLPPLNGFVSELFIYLGLFRTAGIGGAPSAIGATVAAPALAITGALALACFVKAYGAVFLGMPRSRDVTGAHEAPVSMLVPMAVLAACCGVIGLFPGLFAPFLDRAVNAWAPAGVGGVAPPTLTSLAPLGWISVMGLSLVGVSCAGFLALRNRIRSNPGAPVGTWDCGYAAPSPSMQYSSSSFAQMLVQVFAWVLRPREHRPVLDDLFPVPQSFETRVDDAVLDGVVLPASRSVSRVLDRAHLLQQGRIQMYLLYILITLVVLLLSTVPVLDILKDIVTR